MIRNLRGSNRKAGNSRIMRNGGRGNVSGRTEEQRRRRRMVTVDKFILFNLGRNGAASVVNGIQTNDGSERLVTELDKFMRSICEIMLCMYRLNVGWYEFPFFRSCGGG